MPSITFASNCWEKDWDILLKTNFLDNKILRNEVTFTKKTLLINNVKNRGRKSKNTPKKLSTKE